MKLLKKRKDWKQKEKLNKQRKTYFKIFLKNKNYEKTK